ncbi:MAG TPA: 7-carboxy-7-deazaguanine synthase QueE [Armatimonadota bacterium]|jgi:organic radical activating enzyme
MISSVLDNERTGFVHEVFSGIQGEGLYVGERQIFVRLAGCNLECPYCDTGFSRQIPPSCAAEMTAGKRDFEVLQNPLSISRLSTILAALNSQPSLHHSVAITGGEPLVQCDYTAELSCAARALGLKVFLETNGTLPQALGQVLPFLDIVSMDIKLGVEAEEIMQKHRDFLKLAAQCEVYTKIVVTRETSENELDCAAEMIAGVDSTIPLILQPVTPVNGVIPPTPDQVLTWQARCKQRIQTVRVIPQCHKFIGQM